jgi:hypothetical protein
VGAARVKVTLHSLASSNVNALLLEFLGYVLPEDFRLARPTTWVIEPLQLASFQRLALVRAFVCSFW